VTRRLRKRALADLVEAARWYDEQRSGLGRRFLDAVEVTLERIERTPLAVALAAGDVRRASVKRFPYGVFFYVARDVVVVIAIMHDRRAPEHWRSRR
jgi:plasmid stabilization system protein ParE